MVALSVGAPTASASSILSLNVPLRNNSTPSDAQLPQTGDRRILTTWCRSLDIAPMPENQIAAEHIVDGAADPQWAVLGC